MQVLQVDTEGYWSLLASLPNFSSLDWARYRLLVGEYFYRTYQPDPSSTSGSLQLAAGEFEAVLALNPADGDARRFLNQIDRNQNARGLANDLDVTPDFDAFQSAFTRTYPLFDTLFREAIRDFLANLQLAAHADDVKSRVSSIHNSEHALQSDLDAASIGDVAAGKEADHARAQLAELQRQIQAAHDELEHHPDISLGNLAELGLAVAGVAGAVFSGGVSLVALFPAVGLFATDVFTALPGVRGPLLLPDAAERAAVSKSYQDAKKDLDAVIAAGKELVSFAGMIDKSPPALRAIS